MLTRPQPYGAEAIMTHEAKAKAKAEAKTHEAEVKTQEAKAEPRPKRPRWRTNSRGWDLIINSPCDMLNIKKSKNTVSISNISIISFLKFIPRQLASWPQEASRSYFTRLRSINL